MSPNNMFCADQPLDVYKERRNRMRVVASAPVLVILMLTIFSYFLYPSLHSTISMNLTKVVFAICLSLVWLVVIANLQRLKSVTDFYANKSIWVRLTFDAAMLSIVLVWSIWCFYIVGAFEKSFLLNIYALIVYSGSRLVHQQLFSWLTLASGIITCVLTSIFWVWIFKTPKPESFTLFTILETFAALFLGIYFTLVQSFLVKLIEKAFGILSNLLGGVTTQE